VREGAVVGIHVVGVPGPSVATSGIICGALIFIGSWIRASYRHTSVMSWINVLLGAWIIAAAWIFSKNPGDAHTWNYTIVGYANAGGVIAARGAVRRL
jgi:hypothetical protein